MSTGSVSGTVRRSNIRRLILRQSPCSARWRNIPDFDSEVQEAERGDAPSRPCQFTHIADLGLERTVDIDIDVTVLMELEPASRRRAVHLPKGVNADLGAILDFGFGHMPDGDCGFDNREFRHLDEPRPARCDGARRVRGAADEVAGPGSLRGVVGLRPEVEGKVMEPAALIGEILDG